ncbi:MULTISPECIES: hypothetical protein [Actinoallomurus]|uniref:hypothetical protein n=1 Tax=Actinoallomurus TaxID=667113 RepID=UPI002091D895|nr:MULTISPECIES: hypothetical protein [Actinoallomurus]MCO5970953.1 hypothetical protein [Actinoallomurus soli]MCO5992028.1 hypothetical protein [Actinoallomurus rhizosphaericola]
MPSKRRTNSLRYDRDAELRLIAEAGHWLADAGRRRPEAVKSITAMLDRQQRLAACRAFDRPLESS